MFVSRILEAKSSLDNCDPSIIKGAMELSNIFAWSFCQVVKFVF